MTTFVDACVTTLADSTVKVEQVQPVRPRVRKLLNALKGKTNILVTSHLHPDPDALGSAQAIATLLGALLPTAKITIRLKGQVGGGINEGFTRVSQMQYERWDDDTLAAFDAIVLVDTQPGFANSPLPAGFLPTAIIDHHHGSGRRAKVKFADIRVDVGATASILFGYFMEAKVPIPPELAATLLYAIESDLSGIAGQQGGLDTIAISSLTLLADTKRLYRMRYVDLPPAYFTTFGETLANAVYYDDLIVSHLEHADYAEMPGVMADFLLRCRGVNWTMVTAMHENRFVFSLRTKSTEKSAGELAHRISDGLGDGGGHLTKAGGALAIKSSRPADVEALHARLNRRLLRCLEIPKSHRAKLT